MTKKRAAAYIRVSTESAGQIHSYDFQEQYWRGRFENDDETEMHVLYADKGISGSSINKRPQFLTMMQDAREHKFDVIYTKSVSRFSRNPVELLDAVRELRDIGIEVIFEKENIHTFEPTSEVFLTIAVTIAKNDLDVDAERQRWSIKHRIENGWISIGSGIFGYRMTKDNQLIPVPEEAEIVSEIFRRYVAGDGSQKITMWLNSTGVKSYTGKAWQQQSVIRMLQNEKYKGDCLMMKKVKRDGYTLLNTDGRYAQQYYIEDSHTGIVSKEVWQQAQEIMAARTMKKKPQVPNPVYPFTGLIECGDCGEHFRHKINSSGMKWQTGIWTCGRKLRLNKSACANMSIKDSVLQEKFVECYNEFVKTRPQGITVTALQKRIDQLYNNERDLASLLYQHLITEDVYRNEQQHLKAQIKELMDKTAEQRSKLIRASDYKVITVFDPEKVKKFITKVRVSHGTVTFVFYNGVEYTRTYDNGKPGNKPGWNKKEEEA